VRKQSPIHDEAYRAAVAEDGKLSDPEKIDISNLEMRWEK
jgi:hypothetical protein